MSAPRSSSREVRKAEASASTPATFTFDVGTHGTVSGGIFLSPDPIHAATLILAHGAGAPRTHPFMIDIATRIARRGVDVVTFNFLYAEAGRKMPDRVELLEATWCAAIATVRARRGFAHTERIFIGGKSMGGRMATHIAASATAEGLRIGVRERNPHRIDGVVLLGYPLHPMNKPRVVREEIRAVKDIPILVVQGTRDELGTAAEMKKMLASMENVNTRLHVVEDGDHSLVLPKARGAEAQERALEDAAAAVATFIASPIAPPVRRTKTPGGKAKTTKGPARPRRR